MWKCAKCGERHEDYFSSCWKCAGMDAPPPKVTVASPVTMDCVRCNAPLKRAGSKLLHGPANGAVVSEWSELVGRHEQVDAYVCPRCGRLELFVEGYNGAVAPEEVAGQSASAPAPAPSRARGAEATVESLYREGCSLELREELGAAVARYEQVLARFPGTQFARDSEQRLGRIRLKLGI